MSGSDISDVQDISGIQPMEDLSDDNAGSPLDMDDILHSILHEQNETNKVSYNIAFNLNRSRSFELLHLNVYGHIIFV